MIIEKHKLYDKQSILNIPMTHAVNWSNLTTYTAGSAGGCLACPDGLDWGQVLKFRESVYLKNQGKLNDNTTAGVVEVYFGSYHIDHITRTVTYDSTTGLYSFDTAPLLPPFVPVTDTTYIIFRPYDVIRSSGSEDEVSAVLRNVTQVGATTVYTFTLDGAEIITGANAMSAWAVPIAGWNYNVFTANAWHHTTGSNIPLISNTWNPVIGVTYKLVVTLSGVTTQGTGLIITAGGMTQSVISANGTYTMFFTAESTAQVTFTLGAGGTWVGDISAVSVTINDQKINSLLQKNIANRKVDFYKYSIPALTTERGIVLACGESYSGDFTHDVCVYYRGTVDQTLVFQQLA